jgi:2-dehydropantoate 2-reductase
MKEIKKVSLIGLGAMGSFFAPRLYKKLGQNFRIIAGGERRQRLENTGVTINGENIKFPIVSPDEAGDEADLVIVATKGYNLQQAILDIKNQVGPHTQILSVLNGVDSEEKLIAVYGEQRVLYSYMRVSIVMRDGVTNFDPSSGYVHFGEKINEKGNYTPRVQAISKLFDSCGIAYVIDSDMIKGIWFKFACNVGENLTCALLGIPFGAYKCSQQANIIRRGAMREVFAIAGKMGIELGQAQMEQQEKIIQGIPSANKPSTLQDIECGKKTEIDMFAGTVCKLGEKYGVSTPIAELFLNGIKVLEQKNDGMFES